MNFQVSNVVPRTCADSIPALLPVTIVPTELVSLVKGCTRTLPAVCHTILMHPKAVPWSGLSFVVTNAYPERSQTWPGVTEIGCVSAALPWNTTGTAVVLWKSLSAPIPLCVGLFVADDVVLEPPLAVFQPDIAGTLVG